MGLPHETNAPPSSWHWKLAPDSPSVNAKLGLLLLLGLGGVELIAGVGGGVRSIVHE